jgi:hypothetical protein
MVNWFKSIFKGKPTPLEAKARQIMEEAMREEAARTAEASELIGIRNTFIAAQELTKTPWAMFEVIGFEDDGKIKVEFNWNDAFIKRLESLGFVAETPEDSVQLFFYTAQMRPTSLDGDTAVQSDDLPTLSSPVNRIVK